MSKVAEILSEMARNAGDAALRRGALLGNTVSNIANVPAQYYADLDKKKLEDLHTAQVQQQMGLEQARGARETELASHQTAADAQAVADRQHWGQIIKDYTAGSPNDPTKYDLSAGLATAQKIAPEKIPDLLKFHESVQPQVENAAPGSAARYKTGPNIGTVVPNSAVPEEADKGAYTINGQRFDKTGKPIGALVPTQTAPKSLESKPVLLDGKPAIVNYNPATGKHLLPDGTDVSDRVKPQPPASMTVNPALVPSGDALTMAARRYLATGDLPAMGMGQAGAAARVAVMNEAAKIDPAASLAANKAVYKSDTANLTKLQTTEGTLSAFEKAAGKNLDQFLTLADKIPDTGVPWLNTPVRLLTKELVGSDNMAAITAARDVALREIARVTNDPKLSGSLTDSARAEVAGLSAQNATLPQIKAVAKVLRQDMANVHAGVNEQIATVKAGLGSNPAAPTAASGTIRARDPQGVLHEAPAGTPLPPGWKPEP